MELKKPMTFTEQIEQLKTHGIVILNTNEALKFLETVNYYRFTGYALQFRNEQSESEYITGTSFETICHLYKLDEALRDIFRYYLE